MAKSLLVFCCCVGGLFARKVGEEFPSKLKRFIPKGYVLADFAKQDLNNDGKPDYILKLNDRREALPGDQREEYRRPFLLIVAGPNGVLKQRVRNDEILLCYDCGGKLGLWEELTTKPGEFSLSFAGGAGGSWRWTISYTFRYDAMKRNWFLEAYTLDSSNGEDQAGEPKIRVYSVNRRELGDITLKKFTHDFDSDRRDWKVTAAKTFFYTDPDKNGGHRKGYVLKGDKVQAYALYRNFVGCSFTNKKGVTSEGFILRSHMVPLRKKRV